MDIIKNTQGQSDTWEVALHGKMRYEDRENFKDIAFAFSKYGIKKITLDFDRLDYIDSLGIGMLLLMREDALNHDGDIVIINLKGRVKTLFKYSELEKIFAIA